MNALAVAFMLHNHWLILQLLDDQLTSNAPSYFCSCTRQTREPET